MPGRKLYVYGIFIATIISILAACSQVTSPDLAFSALLTENLVNPVGIENPAPAFSWVVETGGHGREQSAYHLLVATSADLLSPEKADAWNPGKMASPESVHVQYEGKVLQLGKEYWWRVRIWDEAGRPSEWSAPHSFETGIPGEKDWQSATWLSLKEDTRTSEYRFREVHTRRMEQPEKRTSYPVGYFRREFRVGGRLKEARAYVCGLGYYELYLNGARLGDHVLDPAPTSYDHHALYVTYDITRALQKGANTAGIILGSGFYGQNMAFNTPFLLYGKPAFRILIRLDYRDGSTEYVVWGSLLPFSGHPLRLPG